jgi:hypothetical protein
MNEPLSTSILADPGLLPLAPEERLRLSSLISHLQVGEIDPPGALRELSPRDSDLVRRIALDRLERLLAEVEAEEMK